MTVIERGATRQECAEHGRPAEPGYYLRCPTCDGPMVMVEYDLVPAGQHRGAVDALCEVERRLSDVRTAANGADRERQIVETLGLVRAIVRGQ